MLQITIDTNQATRWELLATADYLSKLANPEEIKIVVSTGADAEVIKHNPHTGKERDPRDVQSDPQAILCVKPSEALVTAQRTPAPPFPHGEGFEDPGSSAPPVVIPATAPTLADQARATFGAAVVSAPAPAVDPILAAFANQGAAALPNGALSTAAAPPIVTAPVAPPANSAPSTSTPSAPLAPPAPAVQTAAPATSANVDKIGMPWDERIHAGTKAKNADGTWRTKRGVDPALVTTVTAELKQLMAIKVTGPNDSGIPWPFAVPGAAPAVPNVPAAPAPSPTTPIFVPPATLAPAEVVAKLAAATTFAELMASIPDLVGSQLMAYNEVGEVCAELGLPNGVQGLPARPDLIVPLVQKLVARVSS